MLFSVNRLKELGIDLDIKTLSDSLFQLGHEVEEIEDKYIDKLVIGEVLKVIKHPDADKLSICDVNVGDKTLQIVCGASNIKEGLKVIVALEGAQIGELKIAPVKLKGVESNGMICSLAELGYSKDKLSSKDYEGIHEINEDVNVGDNPMEVLKLDDKILDVFLTANRGDCQSYKGLYNDLISLINYNGNNKKLKKYKIDADDFKKKITLENNYKLEVDQSECDFFSMQYIKDVEVKESSWEDKIYLLKQGVKSQNSITDISNKVLIETGIPSHIYDADKINGLLKVCLLETEEEFKGLDEKEITLPKGTLVIKDKEKIVALAGVMGSYETRITSNTKNVLVEVASFNPKSVFNSSKLIGKKTDAALRYEKSIDTNTISLVNKLIVNKISDKNNNCEISELEEVDNKKNDKVSIELEYKTVKKVLGIEICKDSIISILTNLDFEVEDKGDFLVAYAPFYRKDMEIENDLIEEIIRVYNIDNIDIDGNMSTFLTTDKVIKDTKNDFVKKIEKNLLKQGLNQLITYSLINEKQAKEFSKDIDLSVELMSPLSNEHRYYRQSLLPSLIDVVKNNYSYQEKYNTSFEIAQTYEQTKELKEDTKLAIIMSGECENYYLGQKRKYDFYDIKAKLENLFSELNLYFKLEKEENIKELNPYASAKIIVDNKEIGVIGEVVFDYYKKMTEKIYVLELSLNELKDIKESKKSTKYESISFLPSINRDLTIEVNKEEEFKEIISIFNDINYLENYTLIDIYDGEHISEDKKSITFRLKFSDKKETLTNEIIDIEVEKIFNISDKKGYVINGR